MQKYNIYYILQNGICIADHILPLYDVLNGQLLLIANKYADGITEEYLIKQKYKYKKVTYSHVKKILKNKNNIVICSNFVSLCRNNNNMINIRHGISDKVYYLRYISESEYDKYNTVPSLKKNRKYPMLSFVKYINNNLGYNSDSIKKKYKIDPNKKTILLLPTMKYGKFSILLNDNTKKTVFKQLNKLKNEYNIIWKYHPLNLPQKYYYDIIFKYPLNLPQKYYYNENYYNPLPFIEIADIIIGEVSSSTSMATYFHDKPIILLLDNFYKTINKQAEGIVLGNKECILQYKNNFNLIKAVKMASHEDNIRVNNRKKYFDKWFGKIDGTENIKLKNILVNLMSRPDFETILKKKGNKKTRYLEYLLDSHA